LKIADGFLAEIDQQKDNSKHHANLTKGKFTKIGHKTFTLGPKASIIALYWGLL